MEVFAANGYDGTTVDDIVAASGTSKGAFYHYFSSKQDVFLTLMGTLADLVENGVEAAIEAERGALAKVDAALRVVLETAAAQRGLARILLVEAVGVGPEVERARLEIHRRSSSVTWTGPWRRGRSHPRTPRWPPGRGWGPSMK